MSVTTGAEHGPTAGESWTGLAACAGARSGRGSDPDAMFVQGAAQREARLVCFACEVRMECLVEAFETVMEFGVWGGLTERERRAMVRQAAGSTVPWRQRLLYDSELRTRFEQERLRAADGTARFPEKRLGAARRVLP